MNESVCRAGLEVALVEPPGILARKKHGFGVPVGAWFRGELRPMLEDVLLASPRLASRLRADALTREVPVVLVADSAQKGLVLRGFDLGAMRLEFAARDMSLPLGQDIRATADADLLATWRPPTSGERSLPKITGNVLFRSFEYRRPVSMTAELQALGHRGKRTRVETYDPSEDVVDLDVTLRSARALQIRNELVEADLLLADEGLILTGTNGRFGVRGTVEIKQGGRITLRRNVFEITRGTVRFDDLLGIDYFRSFYQRSANVFGAMPSLHVAFPAGTTLALLPMGRRWWIPCLVMTLLVAFAAVYFQHHYVLDVLAGFACALLAWLGVKAALKRWGSILQAPATGET